MKLYAITHWSELFETAETRKLINLTWWAKPNKHDGLGFRRLAAARNRVELYCAWTLIGDIASRTPKPNRGALLRNGKPLTPQDLEVMTGFPFAIFEKAFDFFSDPEQGWLTVVEVNSEAGKAAAPLRGGGAPATQPKDGTSPRSPADPPAIPADPPGIVVTAGTSDGCTKSPGVPGDSPGGREGRERREGIEGREREHTLAHIPSEGEFVAEFMADGIPEEYLRRQFAKLEGNNEWLDRFGRLKRYHVLVRSWWAQDRATWRTKRNEPQVNAI